MVHSSSDNETCRQEESDSGGKISQETNANIDKYKLERTEILYEGER